MASFPLDKLNFGQQAVIKQLKPESRAFRHRLLAMGILPGCKILLLRSAPFGDPIEVCAQGFYLSLRRHEAASIIVTEVSE